MVWERQHKTEPTTQVNGEQELSPGDRLLTGVLRPSDTPQGFLALPGWAGSLLGRHSGEAMSPLGKYAISSEQLGSALMKQEAEEHMVAEWRGQGGRSTANAGALPQGSREPIITDRTGTWHPHDDLRGPQEDHFWPRVLGPASDLLCLAS